MIPCRWTGDAMEPLRGHAKRADKEWVVGQVYQIEAIEPRSGAAHKQFFAAVRDVWSTLPEHLAEQFPNPERLRKWCLIKAGYRDERSIVCASKAEAQRVAAFITPMDEYAIVTVAQCVVTVYTAKSQSIRAMGAKDFYVSKERVFDVLAELTGADVTSMRSESGRAA